LIANRASGNAIAERQSDQSLVSEKCELIYNRRPKRRMRNRPCHPADPSSHDEAFGWVSVHERPLTERCIDDELRVPERSNIPSRSSTYA
jgi:hypothetical protein